MSQQIQDLVEELRSTGYHGRDAWLQGVEPRKGTRIAAIRQLEVCSSQMASSWVEGVMDEQELWALFRSHFLPRILAIEAIIDSTFATPKVSFGDEDASIRQVCAAIRSQVEAIEHEDAHPNYGVFAVILLVSVMVLRQLAEAQKLDSEARNQFMFESTNVARPFMLQCLAKSGFTPDLREGTPLRELAERIHVVSLNGARPDGDPLDSSESSRMFRAAKAPSSSSDA
jgi:hypothetical protein